MTDFVDTFFDRSVLTFVSIFAEPPCFVRQHDDEDKLPGVPLRHFKEAALMVQAIL